MSLKNRLAAGDLTVGSWLTLAHPGIAEIMAGAGFDWLVIDTEHSAIGIGDVESLLRAAAVHACPVIVRLTSNDANQAKRVMDSGATGIMVPMVNSVADAERAVAAAYYPPRGARGVGLARAHAYGADFAGYLQWSDANTVVVAMIEHIDAVQAIDEILSVPGLDAFIIGPYDLSGSMGLAGQHEHPDVNAAIDTVLRAGLRVNLPGGIHVVEPDVAKLIGYVDAGFRFLGYGLDIRFLDHSCREGLARIRKHDA
jgi:2-dehydro-3-deoxyglucarate aldolase